MQGQFSQAGREGVTLWSDKVRVEFVGLGQNGLNAISATKGRITLPQGQLGAGADNPFLRHVHFGQ